ncbi:MAG: DMT family transporter [Anaerolineales bacterium]|jgi:drug/metabolite transporter (DMT)-like permease
MTDSSSHHLKAVLQALFVTFLWATSWVLIKIGLRDLPALSFAGLRYLLAFLVLLPLALRPAARTRLRELPPRRWGSLILLGLLLYSVTQGAQFVSLVYLPAATASLLLSFTIVLVAFIGAAALHERPTWLQWLGIALYLGAVGLYYQRPSGGLGGATGGVTVGYIVALVGVLANALAAVLGRQVNRERSLDPLTITTVSMGVGSLVLFAIGLLLQGLPRLTLANWLIVLWLAVVNSAFAFTLWNRTLQELSAMESSLINNTMLFQIALLAWIFLGEALTPLQWLSLGVAVVATVLVQIKPRAAAKSTLG